MDNVIDATMRFAQPRNEKARTPQLDKLRQSGRTSRNDAIMLAHRLGEIAQKLSPKNPKAAARQWFDALWDGDRWDKRKRFILFPGETAPDPVASAGADWAALIQQAATALFPDDSTTSAKERARICREVLRGTSFLPATNASPLRSDSAQALMVALASRTCEAIEAKTEIVELWEALEETPFDLQSYDLAQPECDEEDINDPLIAAIRASDRYEGDAFSRGPLGDAARKAADVSRYRYRQVLGQAIALNREAVMAMKIGHSLSSSLALSVIDGQAASSSFRTTSPTNFRSTRSSRTETKRQTSASWSGS